MNSFPHIWSTNENTDTITYDSVKQHNEAGLNGQTDYRSGYHILQKTDIKQAKLYGNLKWILIWFCGGIQGRGNSTVTQTAVVVGKNKVRVTYSQLTAGQGQKRNKQPWTT